MASALRPPTAPYNKPPLLQFDIKNSYYTDLYRSLRAHVRDYVESSTAPYAHEWEEARQSLSDSATARWGSASCIP